MDAQADVGTVAALDELLRDANVSRREFAKVADRLQGLAFGVSYGWTPDTEAIRFARFFEALTCADRAGCSSLLRLWGIR